MPNSSPKLDDILVPGSSSSFTKSPSGSATNPVVDSMNTTDIIINPLSSHHHRNQNDQGDPDKDKDKDYNSTKEQEIEHLHHQAPEIRSLDSSHNTEPDHHVNNSDDNIFPPTTNGKKTPSAIVDDNATIINEEQENFQFYEDLDLIEIPVKSSWLYVNNRPMIWNVAAVALLIPFGMLEGFGFFKVGIVDPLAFTRQFTLSAWVILNLFIGAVGGSMIIFSIFELVVPSFWARKSDSRNNKTGYLRAILGGSMCGVGMALAGVGSTMLPAQVGAGVGNSWASVVGFFLGALAFSVVEKFFISNHLKESCKIDRKVEKLTLDEKVGIRFHKLGIPTGLAMLGFAFALEFGIPGTTTADNSEKLSMGKLGWPAVGGGLVVALNQAVLLLISNNQQGGSTCIVNVVSLLSGGYLAPQYFPFTTSWRPRWGVHVSQFIFVWIGTSIGAKIAELTSGPEGQHSPRFEISIWRQLVGGFLSIFGARYSDSCACGGLTSVGSLSLEGTLLAIFMFGSAIGTGFIIQAVENH